jgi:hypothetical protein
MLTRPECQASLGKLDWQHKVLAALQSITAHLESKPATNFYMIYASSPYQTCATSYQ